MTTIRDVAKVAGVGIGTVSRVLSGHPNVAEETRQRVQAAIDQLEYRSSPVARALRRGRTGVIEVLVPLFTRHFYVEVLRGIAEAATNQGYTLMIRTIESPADRDRAFALCGAPGSADGVLLVSLAPPAALLRRLDAAGVPLVLVDRTDADRPSIGVNHSAAMAAALEHLVGLGHRRIALIDRREDPFAHEEPGGRKAGYRQALADAGLPIRPAYDIVTEYTPEAAQAALGALLALPEPPTAVLTGSDSQALGVLEAARHLGRRVPADLSVVGYNDIDVAPYLGLTTVCVPMYDMGCAGSELLLDLLDHQGTAPASRCFPADLVVRATTGPWPPGGE
jgi:LacI family transcriptional regulator/LacI family repressor for deo operon, udp, cdd, tsx, nupC, and nupG